MTIQTKPDETLDGAVLYNVPFPKNLEHLKDMGPIVMRYPYHVDYIHSYGQDSPWFAGLANKKLLGTVCPKCGYKHTTPKLACIKCGSECDWKELPAEGKVHTFTVCQFGAEEFLKETPFALALIEFEGWDTLLLTRLMGVDLAAPTMKWVGMKVKPKFRRNSKFKPTDVWFIPA